MGLDVRVFGNIKLAENENDADFTASVAHEEWKHKIKNLQYRKEYSGDVVFTGVSYSYSAHNRFRELLIRLIDRDDLLDNKGEIRWRELTSEIPFYDFIDFADNEGCLDWEISSIIYNDFEKFKDKAKLIMNEYEFSRYQTWLETFKFAKNNGVVQFW